MFQVSSLNLTTIYVQDNSYVTKNKHKAKIYTKNYFYLISIILKDNSYLIDTFKKVFIHLVSNIVLSHLLDIIETASKKYVTKLATINDIHSEYLTAKFRSYIERDKTERIHINKNEFRFFAEIDQVDQFLSDLFCVLCVKITYYVASLPARYKLWLIILLLFQNDTNITDVHTNSRDLYQCLVIPLKKFSDREIVLPYLNALQLK